MNAPREAFLHDKLQALQAQADEFIAVRRDIHKHPEMGYKEYRTSDLVAEQLSAWGYQVTRGLGGTGLVGEIARLQRDMAELIALKNQGVGIIVAVSIFGVLIVLGLRNLIVGWITPHP